MPATPSSGAHRGMRCIDTSTTATHRDQRDEHRHRTSTRGVRQVAGAQTEDAPPDHHAREEPEHAHDGGAIRYQAHDRTQGSAEQRHVVQIEAENIS